LTLFLVFLRIQMRVRAPLVPLQLFRLRNLATANAVCVLWAAGLFAWFFISALYLQRILAYTALQVGLAFLPANLIMAVFSVGLSARLVMRFGQKRPLAGGLLLAALGLALFARMPLQGHFALDVLPGMLLIGLGAGLAFNPLLLVAMGDVEVSQAGLASGIVNTAFMMGGALALAILASAAAARAKELMSSGSSALLALNAGYHVAFGVGAACVAVGALACIALLRPQPSAQGVSATTEVRSAASSF
jgi:sugar phosphate permease